MSTPFIGFPSAWKDFLTGALGLLLIVLSMWSSIVARSGFTFRKKKKPEVVEKPFVDGHGQSISGESESVINSLNPLHE